MSELAHGRWQYLCSQQKNWTFIFRPCTFFHSTTHDFARLVVIKTIWCVMLWDNRIARDCPFSRTQVFYLFVLRQGAAVSLFPNFVFWTTNRIFLQRCQGPFNRAHPFEACCKATQRPDGITRRGHAVISILQFLRWSDSDVVASRAEAPE